MLAERARVPLAIVAAVSIVTTIGVLARSAKQCPQRAAIIVESIPSEGAIELTDFCPPHVRAAIHLSADATMYCVRGQFPEPGTFVFAKYTTTETWERFAVVGDDGQLIVPMLDRPAAR